MIRGVLRGITAAVHRVLPTREKLDLWWWQRRVRRTGARSVLNLGYSPADVERVTEWQKGILFPVLRSRLRGDERTVLDFGCGPGRFTGDLADLIGEHAIGVDPMQALLDAAPRHGDVEYRLLREGRIPVEDSSVDVAWICLVLMCITDPRALERTVAEIHRVLRPGGLIFLVENTELKSDTRHLRYRSVDDYRALFADAALEHEADYEDRGERISIMAGRMPKVQPSV